MGRGGFNTMADYRFERPGQSSGSLVGFCKLLSVRNLVETRLSLFARK